MQQIPSQWNTSKYLQTARNINNRGEKEGRNGKIQELAPPLQAIFHFVPNHYLRFSY